jgi:hypothetical protein
VGLYTYVFGDIAADTRYNTALPSDLTVEGQEHSGSVDFSVTYTASADSGWNLVGNPYTATIDWDDAGNWTKTNIDQAIYVWDYDTNQYKTWNGTTGDLGSGLIAPFQGFWIKANSASPSLIVDEDAKTTGGTFVGKRQQEEQAAPPNFSISVSDDINATSTHFMFSDAASLNKDQEDAYRLVPPPGIPSYLDLSSITKDGTRFSINHLPKDFGIPIEISLSLDVYENGYSVDQELHFLFENFENIPQGWSIFLVDTKTGSEIDIIENNTYLFSFKGANGKRAPNKSLGSKPKITEKASGKNSRFLIRIEPGSESTDLPQEFKLEQNYPNPFNPTTKIQFDLPLQSYISLKIYDMLGREVSSIVSEELSVGTHTYSWDASRFSSGIYLYRLVTSEAVVTKKMTLIK